MSSWVRVSGEAPCGTCGKTDWCSTSRDGSFAICRRHDDGSGRAKIDRNGGEYWVYRRAAATDEARAPWPVTPARSSVVPAPARVHQVYASILAVLKLDPADRADLRARGLNDSEIDRREYRTLAPHDRRRALARALKLYGEAACLLVPGVVLRRENRDAYACLAGAPGLLIPVRDASGLIVALKLRRRTSAPRRYAYLSSVAAGGPGPGAPVHVPSFADAVGGTVRVTEGELKADVATAVSGLLTISIAGVGTWRRALPTLRELGAHTCRLAFDADVRTNRFVATALNNLAMELTRQGFGVELELWDARFKGIDDCLAAAGAITLWRGAAALNECRRILAGTTPAPTSDGALSA